MTAQPEAAPYGDRSAHWRVSGRHMCMIGVTVHDDGSITGHVAGTSNGFTSTPDRVVTFSAADVRRLRIRVVAR